MTEKDKNTGNPMLHEKCNVRDVEITNIEAGERIRVDSGDILSLAENIKTHGLLNPITVMEQADGGYFLVAGFRRLKAVSLLGRESIAANVLSPVDAEERLYLEISENEARKSFNCSERLAYAEKIKVVEREKARRRQAVRTKDGCRIIPENEKGRTRDIVAKKVGFASGRTLDRAFFVAENRPDLIPLIDREELTVFNAYQIAKESVAARTQNNGKPDASNPKGKRKVELSEGNTVELVQLPPLFLPESIKTTGMGIGGADHNELMSNPVYRTLYNTYNELVHAVAKMEMLDAQEREEHRIQTRQLKKQLAKSTHRIAELEATLNGKRVTGCA